MTDVVFTFDAITWDAACRRGLCFGEDRLAQALLDSPRVRRLIVSNAPRSLPVKLVKDAARRPEPFPASERAWLHEPLRLRRRDPVDIRALKRACRRWERGLRRAAGRRGLERPAVITAQPLLAAFGDFAWAGPVTLYATDDWVGYPPALRWRAAYEEAYSRIGSSGRRVCAVSEAIIDRIEPTAESAVVPNAVDPEEWRDPAPPPPWFMRLPGPRVLYLGALDTRLHIEAVRRVAQQLREGTVVLVGPLLEPAHVKPLAVLPNVKLAPEASRAEVAALMSAADVGLVPHVETELTRAMSPLKLYEYLAAGCPVAAIDLPPLRGVDERVSLAAGADELPAAVRRALELGPASEQVRGEFLGANGWPARTERVLQLALA